MTTSKIDIKSIVDNIAKKMLDIEKKNDGNIIVSLHPHNKDTTVLLTKILIFNDKEITNMYDRIYSAISSAIESGITAYIAESQKA